jgi:hypothetical protein
VARLKHLVVVVPGIGGSALQTAEGAARWDERHRRFIAAATRPKRLGLDRHPDLVPVGLLPDITLVGPFIVPGYDGLVRRIRNRFDDARVDIAVPGRQRDLSADLVLFPYDFRRSIRHAAERLAAEVSARLDGEHTSARRRRVIVVAHSMGGLVARYWSGPLGGAADCEALITLGTPHRGAPKALDVLLNGARVGPVRLGGLSKVLREWPSVYELLPRYPMVAGADDEAGPLRPFEMAEAVWGGTGAAARAKDAFGVHQDIETAWDELAGRPGCPGVTAVFGRGHGTAQLAEPSPSGLTVSRVSPAWLPNPDWLGDGTVPGISAVPIELGDVRARRAVAERHLPLASSPVVADVLAEYAGESLDAVRGDRPDGPWLGLDLDETVPAGHPVQVTVALHGVEPDERTRVLVRARPHGGQNGGPTGTSWLPCTVDADGRWQAEMPPLNAGAHRVEVAATGVPFVDRLSAGDVIGVVDAQNPDGMRADG